MKIKIQIPEPLTLKVDGVTAPDKMTFAYFIRAVVDNDNRMNDSGAAIRASVRIDKAISDASPGSIIELDEEDHKLLAAVVEQPQGGYPTLLLQSPNGTGVTRQVARQLLPFIDAMTPLPEDPKAAVQVPKRKSVDKPS